MRTRVTAASNNLTQPNRSPDDQPDLKEEEKASVENAQRDKDTMRIEAEAREGKMVSSIDEMAKVLHPTPYTR